MKKILFSCVLFLGISIVSSASNSTTDLPINNSKMQSCTMQMTSSCGQTWNIWMQDCTWESVLEAVEEIEHICEIDELP